MNFKNANKLITGGASGQRRTGPSKVSVRLPPHKILADDTPPCKRFVFLFDEVFGTYRTMNNFTGRKSNS